MLAIPFLLCASPTQFAPAPAPLPDLHRVSSGATVLNTRLAAAGPSVFPWNNELGSEGAALRVYEVGQGQDLNGDGDTNDRVLELRGLDRLRAVGSSATGVPVQGVGPRSVLSQSSSIPQSMPFLDGNGFALFLRDEFFESRDLNGDGDVGDRVVHVLDLDTGLQRNLRIAASRLDADGPFGSFVAEEGGQGQDWNGDGDTSDSVLYVYDHRSRTLTNTMLAVFSAQARADTFTALVDEADQGEGDLNGDGDTLDRVVFHWSPDGAVNLGLAASFPPGGRGDLIAVGVSESSHGLDLNGDGDLLDDVLHAYQRSTATTTNLGVACVAPQSGDRFTLFALLEASQSADLNGDGDTLDIVLAIHDAVDGSTLATGLATTGGNVLLLEDGGRVLFSVSEVNQGQTDLNGDGDTLGNSLFVYDGDTKQLTNLTIDAQAWQSEIRAGRILTRVPERGVRDLNGDGDPFDSVYHIIELP